MKRRNNQGFSLVELVISLAILGVLCLILFMFMQTGGNMFGKISRISSQEMNSQTALAQMREYIVDCNGKITIGAVTTAGQTMAIELKSVNMADGTKKNIKYTFEYIANAADPDKGKITIDEEITDPSTGNVTNSGHTPVNLIDRVKSCVFTSEFSDKVIHIKLECVNYKPPETYITLRNKCEVVVIT
ncbi:MAG: type II secretion system GspH family protein [Oscillospiraceae bacterium]|jgi:prepilin-type N-terminal cleavage/methylation domain-containing protein|nr:type II secretion system GspH family protein [Oscillospiraceae bacterium]